MLDHKYPAGTRQKFLVRWKHCDASMDSWIPRAHVTLEALVAYEKFLKAHTDDKTDPVRLEIRQRKYRSMIGDKGQFSAIAELQKEQARRVRGSVVTSESRNPDPATARAQANQARAARRRQRDQPQTPASPSG